MSVSAVSHTPTTSSSGTSSSSLDPSQAWNEGFTIDGGEYGPYYKKFLFLIPTITGIAIGILLFPHFGLGLAVGAAGLVVTVIAMSVLSHMGILKSSEDKNSEYEKHIHKSLLEVALFGPIAEEGLFRGFMQPLLTRSIQILVPAAATAVFLGTGMGVATAVSIAVTAVVFGGIHYFNPHKDSHIQAVAATVSGVVMGVLAAQFGIGAAIAAHVANNTIPSLFFAFVPARKREEVRPQMRPDFSPVPI
jgi:membrane protease YdiL (CAAX protease family)